MAGAYRTIRLNITPAGFPLLSELSGHTVIIPGLDQDNISKGSAGVESKIPSVVYCHNVMPTLQGYQSIGYDSIVPEVTSVIGTYAALYPRTYEELSSYTYEQLLTLEPDENSLKFTRVLEVRDANQNTAYVGVTIDNTVWLYTATRGIWNLLATPSWQGGDISVAVVFLSTGITSFLCLENFGIFIVDIANTVLVTPNFIGGITISSVKGIATAYNYLILYNDQYVQWSSAFDPLDFDLTNAIITGTGYGIPIGISGTITAVLPIQGGYIVYTTRNAVIASYSGNTQYPWTYTAVPNSAGVSSNKHITSSEKGSAYAWTGVGLQEVVRPDAVSILPEVTDFLASRVFETYNETTDRLEVTYVSQDTAVLVRYIQKRYLVISYDKADSSLPQPIYSYALVLDTLLDRWGKLKIDHVDTIDIAPTSSSNLTGSAKRTIGFLAITGEIKVVNFDLANTAVTGVLLLGKIKIDRQDIVTLLETSLENIDQTANFQLQIGVSYKGKDLQYPLVQPYLAVNKSKARTYNSLISGDDHILFMKGAFNLVSLQVMVRNNGSR